MMDVKGRLKDVRNDVRNREKWAARGASFMAKAKATKVVWFPPKPVETAEKTASTATQATKRPARKATGAAKKTTNSVKGTANPVRRKET
jgi:hypothetical protein